MNRAAVASPGNLPSGRTLKECLEPAQNLLVASGLLLMALDRTVMATRTHVWLPVVTGWLIVLSASLPCLLTFVFEKRPTARDEGSTKVSAEEKTPQAERKERRATGWMIAVGLAFCLCGTSFTGGFVRGLSRPDVSLFLKVLSVNALAIFWPAQIWWWTKVAAYVGEARRARQLARFTEGRQP